eukprot:XP_014017235.1 PREDICTED: DBH-like monooxygenase protein 2 homolog isoform X2 [Salmo salar]
MKLINAYGETDDIGYHAKRRGTKEVNLLKFMPRYRLLDINYLEFVGENIEPMIEHLDLVHHMLVYGCSLSLNQTYVQKCFTGGPADECFRVVFAWGVGGGAFDLPEIRWHPYWRTGL